MDQMLPTYSHLPRLYSSVSLKNGSFLLGEAQSHYLRHVLRLQENETVRVFNSIDGEWLAHISLVGKRDVSLTCTNCLREAVAEQHRIHLLFSPIKKDRMDFMIEKSVELGVTDLHPLLMHRSVVRDIKVERLQAQIIEAVEQCERLDVPRLHALVSLEKFVQQFPNLYQGRILAALERQEVISIQDVSDKSQKSSLDIFYLVGPEGGFDTEEISLLQNSTHVCPVSLGPRILRAETAALFGLSLLG